MRRALCVTGASLLLATGLLAMLGPRFLPGSFACGRKNHWIARVKCKEYHDAAAMWAKLRGEPPARLEDMQAPLRPGESAFEEILDDPWGNPYVMEHAGTGVRVRCLGADGVSGTDDDIAFPEEVR